MNETVPAITAGPAFALRLSRRQIVLVLVGFPALYLVNHVTPWTFGIFASGDRAWYLPFVLSILTLHWLTLVVMIRQVRRAGGTLSDIGLQLSPARAITAVIVFALAGAGLLWLRSTWALPDKPPEGWQIIYPVTWAERATMLLVAFTAGVCEELIYRGYALQALRGRGMRLWLALLLSGLSFGMIHGIAGVILMPMYLIVHALFAALFLWRKSLWPGIYLHVLWDMMMVLAV